MDANDQQDQLKTTYLEYSNKIIENALSKFQTLIGKDLQLYRNHVYRVFLNCLIIDPIKENEPKYAIAAVFHDIGIWTDGTFDYLSPSIKEAKKYLVESQKQEWIEEITLIIYWHHKINIYDGAYATLVENFRKADWIDVSLGLKTFGYDSAKIKANMAAIPNAGFHLFLLKKAALNFLNHPLRPLPMFKK